MKRFPTSIHSQVAAYIHALSILFIAAFALTTFMSVMGCTSCCGDKDPPTTSQESEHKTTKQVTMPKLYGPGVVKPGQTVKINSGMLAADATVTWTPPPGVTNVAYNPPPDPGGPPYVFHLNVYSSLSVSYRAPSSETKLVDTFETKYTDGSKATSSIQTQVSNSTTNVVAGTSGLKLSVIHSQDAPVTMWEVQKWIDINGITLTTDLCNDIHNLLTSDQFFIASRMPLGSGVPTTSYALPFAMGDPYSQTIYLAKYGGVAPNILTYTVEYRPERANLAANDLPSANGEHWVTWGLTPTQDMTCPTGLAVAPNHWGIVSKLLLDLHDQPNTCDGCEVRTYYCYEGQDPPAMFKSQQAALALQVTALGRAVGAASYQGQGITCMDAGPLNLGKGNGLHLGWTEGAWITPTQRITLSEHLVNRNTTPVTVTLTWTSSLQSLWHMYEGTGAAPDLNAPITAGTQIALGTGGSSFRILWLINDVHADTPAGLHDLTITATSVISSSIYVWDNIPLWAEKWVPPDGGAGNHYIYLPVTLKNAP